MLDKHLSDANLTYNQAFWDGFRPDPILSVAEWADKYRVLSNKSSSEPGRWRTSRTPYLKEIMECLSPNSHFEEIVLMKGSQLGGSEVGGNWLGFIIDFCPAPVMAVLPTVDLAKRNSKHRIQPLIDECPRLQSKVKEARERDSGNTILNKEFPGGTLVMTGANSAVGLRSMPVRFLFLDEVSSYPHDLDGEGSPISLARARTKTFARRKIFQVSTPTFAGRCQIEQAYDATDKRHYHVPCPHCNKKQWLKWPNLKFEIIQNKAGQNEPRNVFYQCEHCDQAIHEHHKTWMLENGEWVAEYPGVREGKVAGFHLSSLYSPLGWYSWTDAAQQFLDAEKKPEEMKGFVNTVLGETWKDVGGDAPDWHRLYERRELYDMGNIPTKAVLFITAGVDVQKDRLEIEIKGWCRDKQSYSIDHIVIPGATETEEPWRELEKVLTMEWRHVSGFKLGLKMMAVDSGYNTQHVYNWVRRHPVNRVMATKGTDNSSVLLSAPAAVDVNLKGKKIKRGVKLWSIGTGLAKGEFYANLKQNQPVDGKDYPSGYCHYPQYGDEWFRQICSEQLVARYVRGRKKFEWEKTRERNEALDLHILNRAAASAIGMDRFTSEHWDELEGVRGEIVVESTLAKPESRVNNESLPSTTKPLRESWFNHRKR